MTARVPSGGLAEEFRTSGEPGKEASKTPNAKPKRNDRSPLTLRLKPEERARLETLAAGMTLSAYVRACVFGQEAKRRKRRPKDAVADKAAIAEALALLGQYRIASNLNQLAYHANIGVLQFGAVETRHIEEANEHLREIRSLLVTALRGAAAPREAAKERS